MNEVFEERYRNLNVQQKQAVDAIEGPVMVIAGPGTGKTEILAARICNILKNTDTDANSILCLTYTDAGTTAMRNRLIKYLGDEAYKVNIFTFHALCKNILDTYPMFFDNRNFEVIDELKKYKLLDEVLANLPIDNSLYQGVLKDGRQIDSQNYNVNTGKQIFDFFNIITENKLQREVLSERIDTLLEEENFKIAFGDLVYKIGDRRGQIKEHEYKTRKQGFKKLLDVFEVYEQYNAQKEKLNLADFNDLLLWVKNELDKDSELNLILQEKYQYILVDEFQDTNPLQTDILYHLTAYFQDNPNCFVVGDDDQSIYSFQGADVTNMMKFYEKYKNTIKMVCLTQNYRSSQVILTAAEKYIQLNPDRLVNQIEGISKNLEAKGIFANETQQPVLLNFTSPEAMYTSVAEQIKDLIDSGVKPNEIAVLNKNNFGLQDMATALQIREINFELARSKDILKEPILIDVLRWLQFISKETNGPGQGTEEFFSLLYTQNVDMLEVHKLFGTAKYDDIKTILVLEYLTSEEKKPLDLFKTQFSKIASHVLHLFKIWNSNSPMDILKYLFENLGFIERALNAPDKRNQLQLLYSFIKKMEELSIVNPHQNMEFYLAQIMEYKSYDIPIASLKTLQSGQGVQLTTMHGSKGLEYEYVFITNVDKNGFKHKNKNTFINNFTDVAVNNLFTLPGYGIQGQDKKEQLDLLESRRLWYVAFTRAKKGLTLCCSNKEKPYQYISEMTKVMQEQEMEVHVEKTQSLLAANLKNNDKILKVKDQEWFKNRIANFAFSHSSIMAILKCENMFYFQNILGVQSTSNVSLSFGNAVHNALATLAKNYNNNKTKLSLDEFVREFEINFYSKRGLMSKEQYDVKLLEGKQLLTYYYQQRAQEFWQYSSVIAEHKTTGTVNNTTIKGFIDKIYFTKENGNAVTIVDYKTGNAIKAREKFERPKTEASLNPDKINVGKNEYWLQGLLYAYLIKNEYKDWTIDKIELETLSTEPDKFEKMIFRPEPVHYELIESLINKAIERIHSPSFPSSCNVQKCKWCNFRSTMLMPTEEDADG